ncbi:hypothetical protein AVEN_226083-1 [Araneus ventricosus]|uniref:Uncharacterized protein n=1 Tax=Araneus ventricosus TaxID=182803 RepID=A0A4Y2GRG8_ARAVE|nr:hypothetical protein AVEN_226083-1 [Araneus ventricosus]
MPRITELLNEDSELSKRNKNVTEEFVKKLCSAIGEDNVSTSLAVRDECGTDEGYHGYDIFQWLYLTFGQENVFCKDRKFCC